MYINNSSALTIAVPIFVCFLAISGVGAVVYFVISGGANEKFREFPAIVNSQVMFYAFYLLMAPLQFSKMLRLKSINFHRWSGRLLISAGLISGASALFIGIVIPHSGTAEQLITGFFGSLFLLSLILSYKNVRQKKIQLHLEWMIRALAIGLSIATMRFILVPVIVFNTLDRQGTAN
jgi:hypothetical protein